LLKQSFLELQEEKEDFTIDISQNDFRNCFTNIEEIYYINKIFLIAMEREIERVPIDNVGEAFSFFTTIASSLCCNFKKIFQHHLNRLEN